MLSDDLVLRMYVISESMFPLSNLMLSREACLGSVHSLRRSAPKVLDAKPYMSSQKRVNYPNRTLKEFSTTYSGAHI